MRYGKKPACEKNSIAPRAVDDIAATVDAASALVCTVVATFGSVAAAASAVAANVVIVSDATATIALLLLCEGVCERSRVRACVRACGTFMLARTRACT